MLILKLDVDDGDISVTAIVQIRTYSQGNGLTELLSYQNQE